MSTNDTDSFGSEMCCSFCGKTRSQVSKLIAGPGASTSATSASTRAPT